VTSFESKAKKLVTRHFLLVTEEEYMPQYRKKLIEVALPLEAINANRSREKSIRHGHPRQE